MAATHNRVPGFALGTLADQVALILKASPGGTARAFAALLKAQGREVDKSEINSVLYSQRDRFWNDGSTPPRWHLIDGQVRSSVRPVRTVRALVAPPTLSQADPVRRAPAIALYAWQQDALDAWRQNKRRGVVEAVTGTGKTMVGLAASAEAEKLGGKVQVIVPTIDLLHQWTAQVRQHLPGIRVGQLGDGQYATLPSCDVLISVVNSAQDYEPRLVPTNSLLIADECHRLGSEGNARSLNEGFSARLGLSATYARSDDGNFDYLDPYFTGTCFHMDYARAITDEVTAHFKVALVAVRFVGGEHYAYDEANNKAQKARRRLIEQGLVHAEPFGEFMKDVSALAAGGEGPATWTARSYLNAFAERRRILADTPAKKTKLGDLAASVRSANRSIVFTQTIEAAEDAADILRARGLSAEAIHSGLEQAKRRQTLGLFAEGGLKAIAAPQVLDEGVDVPAADLAIIVAASRTRRQMIQRMGRVLRRKPDGRLARFAILYVEATSEDPAQGAHGDFLDEVTSVADEVRSFSVGAEASDVSAFLNDCWTGKPQPLPRMASSSTGRRLDTSLPVVDGSKAIQTPSKPKAVARVMPKVTAAKQTSPKSMSFQDASVAAIGIEVTRTPGLPRRGWEAVGLSDLTCSECPGRLGVIRNRTSGNIALLCAHDKCAWSVVDYDEGTIALVREYIRVVDDTRGGGLPGGRP